MNQFFEINDRRVEACFELDDLRPDSEASLGQVQMVVHMKVDGVPGYVLLLQNDGDGVLHIARSEAGADDSHNRVFAAFGGEPDEFGAFDQRFGEMLNSVISAGQAAFDAEFD